MIKGKIILNFIKIKSKMIFIIVAVSFSYFCVSNVFAQGVGTAKNFYLDYSYDYSGKSNTSAVLVSETSRLYFYVDSFYWEGLAQQDKDKIISNLSVLGSEFERNIYPTLSLNYGTEWNPGIDNDLRVTILFHKLKAGAGGYFNSGNEYLKYEVPSSNEREMVYLNLDYINSPLVKRLLAHEFTHLITFNQKDKINNTEEDVWLNEARAEYAVTLCGYDSDYYGSNLQKRVIEFLKNQSDSITDWQGLSSDYGALNLFVQYLTEQYGVKILNDSLHSNKKGIDSVNYALKNSGYSKSFADIFSDWTLAVFLNDCSIDTKYCYKNSNLKNLRVILVNNLVDFASNFSIKYSISNWSGAWQKIFYRGDNLAVEISGINKTDFNAYYAVCDLSDKCSVNNISDASNDIFVSDLKNKYLVFIFSMRSASLDNASVLLKMRAAESQSDNTITGLLNQIENLKKQITDIKEKLALINNNKTCQILNDLYFGLKNNSEVSCLQNFLKDQGNTIYSEGLITGNFLMLTNGAVIRFQEKYSDEILKPLGLIKGTGYVGEKTKNMINELLLAKSF